MERKRALVTGITGQDGSYLAELLLEKDYDVFGLVRRTSTPNTSRIDHLLDDLELLVGDMTDSPSIQRVIESVRPDEVYNLAAQSFVGASWNIPVSTFDITATGTIRLLDAIKQANLPATRFYQASSSEMYGKVSESPQCESTRFHPRSPYGVAKLAAHWAAINYRESYEMFTACGILFNHESPRRGEEFVTRKITLAAARIKCGLQDKLYLGNIETKRDWGHAKDYVYAMYLMLQMDTPRDFIIASGEMHTIKEFCTLVFHRLGLSWKDYVEIDPAFYRPAEVEELCGSVVEAKRVLRWACEYDFESLVRDMVDEDLRTVRGSLHESSVV